MSLDFGKFTKFEPGAGKTIRLFPPEDFPVFYEHRVSPEPTHIPFKTDAARHNPPGSPRYKVAMEQDTELLWVQEVEERNGSVESAEEKIIQARHTGHLEGEEDVPGCLACALAKRVASGFPPAKKVWLTVLRDVEPLEMVEYPKTPKLHKKRRWMSEAYHLRIQKKWAKRVAGQTELRPKQERVIISMSMAMAKIISDNISRSRHAK